MDIHFFRDKKRNKKIKTEDALVTKILMFCLKLR